LSNNKWAMAGAVFFAVVCGLLAGLVAIYLRLAGII